MSDLHRYQLHGFTLDSDTPLFEPEVDKAEQGADLTLTTTDLRVDTHLPPAGDVTAERTLDGKPVFTATREATAHKLRIHGIADFTYEPLTGRISCDLDVQSSREVSALVIPGTVIAFVLDVLGHVVLHASTVARGGDAYAFAGHSGTGKSTVAALACLGGAELVADDLLPLRFDNDNAICHPGNTEIRLREAAWSLADDLWQTRTTADGRLAVRPAHTAQAVKSLRAIIVAQPDRSATAIGLVQLRPSSAAMMLMHFPRTIGWTDQSMLAATLTRVSAIAETVPVFVATVPWGPPFDSRLGSQLLDEVESTCRV